MKIEKAYMEWCGKHRLENSNKDVHDSAECIEFAKYWHGKLTEINFNRLAYLVCVKIATTVTNPESQINFDVQKHIEDLLRNELKP